MNMNNSASCASNSSDRPLALQEEKHTSVYQMLLLELKCVMSGGLYGSTKSKVPKEEIKLGRNDSNPCELSMSRAVFLP